MKGPQSVWLLVPYAYRVDEKQRHCPQAVDLFIRVVGEWSTLRKGPINTFKVIQGTLSQRFQWIHVGCFGFLRLEVQRLKACFPLPTWWHRPATPPHCCLSQVPIRRPHTRLDKCNVAVVGPH